MKTFKALALGSAVVAMFALTGCLFSSDKSSGGKADIVVSLGMKGVNGLGKSASVPTGIELKKLIITLTSSNVNDAVIRDTVLSDTGDFSSNSAAPQIVAGRQYSVKALRTWSIEVKTLDTQDSVIHIASETVANLGLSQVRSVTLNLKSRFLVYAAKFTLPDSLASTDPSVTMKQALFVNRFVMVINGVTVRDSTATSGGYFTKSPDEHYLLWNYVDTTVGQQVKLYVFADSTRMADSSEGGWTWPKNKPIFGDSIVVTKIDSVYAPQLPWSGPGSSSDPTCQNNPSCGGGKVGLTINIGAVGRVEIETTTGGLPKRK